MSKQKLTLPKPGFPGMISTSQLVFDSDGILADRARMALPVKEELVASIMSVGIRTPVVVTQSFSIVEGRQRVKATIEANARLAKAKSETEILVPFVFERTDTPEITMIAGNEWRQDDGVVAKARNADALRAMGHTPAQIQGTFGVSKQTLGNWSKLLKLPAPILAQVEAGELSMNEALGLTNGRPAKSEPQDDPQGASDPPQPRTRKVDLAARLDLLASLTEETDIEPYTDAATPMVHALCKALAGRPYDASALTEEIRAALRQVCRTRAV